MEIPLWNYHFFQPHCTPSISTWLELAKWIILRSYYDSKKKYLPKRLWKSYIDMTLSNKSCFLSSLCQLIGELCPSQLTEKNIHPSAAFFSQSRAWREHRTGFDLDHLFMAKCSVLILLVKTVDTIFVCRVSSPFPCTAAQLSAHHKKLGEVCFARLLGGTDGAGVNLQVSLPLLRLLSFRLNTRSGNLLRMYEESCSCSQERGNRRSDQLVEQMRMA